ncbi:MAG: hypothetical protein AAFR95_18545 [Bacteroidota bacterium]
MRDKRAYCQVNLDGLEHEHIVEHGDNAEPVPPSEETVNSSTF